MCLIYIKIKIKIIFEFITFVTFLKLLQLMESLLLRAFVPFESVTVPFILFESVESEGDLPAKSVQHFDTFGTFNIFKRDESATSVGCISSDAQSSSNSRHLVYRPNHSRKTSAHLGTPSERLGDVLESFGSRSCLLSDQNPHVLATNKLSRLRH